MTTDTYVTDPVTGKVSISKDDKAVLDYTFSWVNWLADVTDTITSKTVSIKNDDGTLIVNSSSISGANKVVVWLSAGTVGKTYQLECSIVTAAGRTDERSIYVTVKDR